jgi:hypothetical protein
MSKKHILTKQRKLVNEGKRLDLFLGTSCKYQNNYEIFVQKCLDIENFSYFCNHKGVVRPCAR